MSTAKLGKICTDKLPGSPVHIDCHNWFYIGPRGIELIHEVTGTGPFEGRLVKSDLIIISWPKVRAALTAADRARQ